MLYRKNIKKKFKFTAGNIDEKNIENLTDMINDLYHKEEKNGKNENGKNENKQTPNFQQNFQQNFQKKLGKTFTL